MYRERSSHHRCIDQTGSGIFINKRNATLVLFGLLLACYSAANIFTDLAKITAPRARAAIGQVAENDSIPPFPRMEHSSAVELDFTSPSVLAPGDRTKPWSTADEPDVQPEAMDRLANVEVQPDTPAVHRPATPETPIRLVIPAIALDAPVIPAETEFVEVGGKQYQQWLAPERFAVGWHTSSARLGEIGNTVFNGHHNVHGEVFANLVSLREGDVIFVYSEENKYTYVVTNKMILPEKHEQLTVRMDNARWILPSQDERLTLVTCWPKESNTHRLVIVAKPSSVSQSDSNPVWRAHLEE